jgi:serine/threonine protein kinase
MRLSINSVGKYELRAILARTPLSTVYDGWDSDIARRVAIKLIPISVNEDSDAAEALLRFKRGAQAAGKLNHPNIVAVYDYGEADDHAYLVMEFIDGPTLKQKFDDNQRFGLSDVYVIIGNVLEALQYSHDRGVVHRDIKPANIMFTKDNQVKITDFGIARIEDSDMTQAGMVIGTPAYMSPEQFLGEKIDARTDIYSTGVVLYQMLTGERPYEGNLATIMHKVLYGSPPVPSRISTMVTPSLDKIVTRSMARSRDERFRSAAEFNAALQATRGPAAPRVERVAPAPTRKVSVTGEPRRPAAKAPSAAKSRGLIMVSLAAAVIAAGGLLTWYLFTGRVASQQTASNQITQPVNQPAQKAEPASSQGATNPTQETTQTSAPFAKQEIAASDQQERTRAAISSFVQQPESSAAPDIGRPTFVVPEAAPRSPAPFVPAPSTPAPFTPGISSQREPASQPLPKKSPVASAGPSAGNNQSGPAYVNPDRRPSSADARQSKPGAENAERFAATQGVDSSEAALRRLRSEFSAPPSAPAPRVVPTYAAVSSSPVGLLCQSITAETAGGFGLDSPQGMVVTGVVVGSPADQAGIHQEDVILKIKGKDAYDLSVLAQVAAEAGVGQLVPVEILRHRSHQIVQLQVDRLRR